MTFHHRQASPLQTSFTKKKISLDYKPRASQTLRGSIFARNRREGENSLFLWLRVLFFVFFLRLCFFSSSHVCAFAGPSGSVNGKCLAKNNTPLPSPSFKGKDVWGRNPPGINRAKRGRGKEQISPPLPTLSRIRHKPQEWQIYRCRTS